MAVKKPVKFYTELDGGNNETILFIPTNSEEEREIAEQLKEIVAELYGVNEGLQILGDDSDKCVESAWNSIEKGDLSGLERAQKGMQEISYGTRAITAGLSNTYKGIISSVKGYCISAIENARESLKESLIKVGKQINDNYEKLQNTANRAKESIKGFNERLGLVAEDAKENLLRDKDKALEAGSVFAGAIEAFGQEAVSKAIDIVNKKKDDITLSFIKKEIESIGEEEIIETAENMSLSELKYIAQLSNEAIDIMMKNFESETDLHKKLELAMEIEDYCSVKNNAIYRLTEKVKEEYTDIANEYETAKEEFKYAERSEDPIAYRESIMRKNNAKFREEELKPYFIIENSKISLEPVLNFFDDTKKGLEQKREELEQRREELKNKGFDNVTMEDVEKINEIGEEIKGIDGAIEDIEKEKMKIRDIGEEIKGIDKAIEEIEDYESYKDTFEYQNEEIDRGIQENLEIAESIKDTEKTVDEMLVETDIKERTEKMEDIFSDSKKEQEYKASKEIDEQSIDDDDGVL